MLWNLTKTETDGNWRESGVEALQRRMDELMEGWMEGLKAELAREL
jgi:hypothetical protein